MKCLIYFSEEQVKWLFDFFPDLHPFLLTIANKPLLEYLIDFAVINKINDIRIINGTSNTSLEQKIGDGGRWGINISYNLAKPKDTIKKILAKNIAFARNDDLLIINGFFFIFYKKSIENYQFFSRNDNEYQISDGNNHLIVIRKRESLSTFNFNEIPEIECSDLPIKSINSILDFYQLNMDLIKNHQEDFVFPGYNTEKGIFIGRNVHYPHYVKISKPIFFGDNVQLMDEVIIGSHTIIGDQVLVDMGTSIENSIILSNTYIGNELEIKNKIVHKNHLIDPFTEDVVNVIDKFLISEIKNNLITQISHRIAHFIATIVLKILFIVPYYIFLLFFGLVGSKKVYKEFYFDKNGKTDIIRYRKLKFKMFPFVRMIFEKYPLLNIVLKGKLRLVGNHLILKSKETRYKLDELPVYYPGLFHYSEMLTGDVSEVEKDINELFYSNNLSIKLDIKILVKALMKYCFSLQ